MADSQEVEFETLVSTYYQPLYRFAYSLSKSESEAADLTQQTFLIWAEKGHTLRDTSKVKSWLFTSLYREFLRLNRRGKTISHLEPEIIEAREDTTLTSSPRQMEGKEALAALEELDPVYREPLTLFYLEDLAYKEIADVLGIPIGTVMSRLARAKAQLKSKLSEKTRK